ncbi:hypothetical protein Ahy_A10g050715 isoform E [Arachis hypogaea]|uniref:Uncharacterized protein n=1 Tax=Arachis hypogaea TaxID=3818 RepID=A0A445BA90_ARAHY|nr:hypothetical protein Ahy_A10g050715 isoform E [Arachis hypogaea]
MEMLPKDLEAMQGHQPNHDALETKEGSSFRQILLGLTFTPANATTIVKLPVVKLKRSKPEKLAGLSI